MQQARPARLVCQCARGEHSSWPGGKSALALAAAAALALAPLPAWAVSGGGGTHTYLCNRETRQQSRVQSCSTAGARSICVGHAAAWDTSRLQQSTLQTSWLDEHTLLRRRKWLVV